MKTTKIRIIFFAIALTYNLILGFYLRDFLVLSPTLQVFYLLSVVPTLFLVVEINSKAMRTAVYISLMLIACMNIAYDIRQHFVGFDSAKWDLVNSTMDNSGESIRYVLYLNDILKSGDSFSVFTGVEIPEAMTQEHASHFDDDGVWGFTIDVKAQAVQTENVGANAFAAFQTVGMAIN